MGQQTSNSRIQQIAKSKGFFFNNKCDLQTCEKVVIGALAPFPGIACLADGSKLMMTKGG